jgi:hypothetical protein
MSMGPGPADAVRRAMVESVPEEDDDLARRRTTPSWGRSDRDADNVRTLPDDEPDRGEP